MTALILVDLQNDFLPGGALAVPGGDAVLGPANALSADGDRFGLVVATQDWHPPGHASFAASHAGRKVGEVVDLHGLPQVLWPTHCVAGTRGAMLAGALDQTRVEAVFRKGTDPAIDSYSGLYDNGRRRATGLAAYLRGRGVTRVAVCGLATDYCVKFTALDALRDGFDVELIVNACRGVNLTPGDADAAIAEMQASGVTLS